MNILEQKNIKKEFLFLLDIFTFNSIDDIANNYYFINNDTSKNKTINLVNQISKIYMKHNLERFYNNFDNKKYKFNLDVEKNLDRFFEEYDKILSKKNLIGRAFRWIFNQTIKNLLKNDFKAICKQIDFNRQISAFLTFGNPKYITDFDKLFELLQNMKLNNQDMLDVTLYIMLENIRNGILNIENDSSIIKAHQLVNDSFYECHSYVELDINSICTALECIGYPNTSVIKLIFDKRINKEKEAKRTENIILPQEREKKKLLISPYTMRE